MENKPDILLINPAWIRKKGSIWKGVAGAMPPLGLAYIASFLEKNGFRAAIVDMQVEHRPFEEVVKRLNIEPALIGITAVTTTYNDGIEIAELCRKIFGKAKIVMGGVHPTHTPDEVLKHEFVDYVVRGEGEIPFLKLALEEKKEDILGVSYKKDGKFIHNPQAEHIQNLDLLPFPAYHLLKVERYLPSLGSYRRLPAISMINSRGCPGTCTYCFGAYLGKKIRSHSPRYMADEIKMLKSKYGIKEVAFYDDTFTVYKKKVIEFCNILIKEKIDITWVCFARVDFIDSEMLQIMKKAGLHQILYGVESGNQEILRNIGKRTPLSRVREVINMTKETGVECRISLMLGNPGETRKTLEQTINFSVELDPDLAMYNITTPFPGTKLYEWADKYGYLKTKDWKKYDFATAVMELPTISSFEVEKYYARAHKKFYGRFGYMLKRLLKIRSLNDIIVALKAVLAIWFK